MAAPLVSTIIDQLDDDRIAACGWMELFSAQQDARFYQHPDWFLAADEALLSKPVEVTCVYQASQLKLLLPWQARIQRHRLHAPVHDHLTLGDVLNSVMNGRLLREASFDDVYIMPAAGDNGTSIGAAYTPT